MKKIRNIILYLLAALSALVLPAGSAMASMNPADNPAPALGVEAALERANALNEHISTMTPEQIAAEYNVDLYLTVLDPYGNAGIPGEPVQVNEGDTWQDCVDKLFAKYNTDTYRVGIGYYNTLTGEEQYYNGDKYMISASMFKIPTNMIFADKVSSGEMTMDTEIYGYPYSYLQYETIVNSSNEHWMTLISYLGGYSKFKELQIPYLGNDPTEELGWNYQVDNYYNAQQFIHMLRTIYDDPDRFPGILECMLEATPFANFREYEHRYPIAQKYGFVTQDGGDGTDHTYVTSCGIVYTENPCMIVMFTDNVESAYSLLGEYAVVMADYTNMTADAQKKQQAAEEEEARARAEAEMQAQLEADAAAAAAAQAEAVTATPKPIKGDTVETYVLGSYSVTDCIIMGWVVIMVLSCLVLIFRHNMAGKINGFWAALAAVFAGTAMILCVVALRNGTLVAEPSGNPAETVNTFFNAISNGDYATAYAQLSDYETLGIENQPSTEESRMFYDALVSSYDYNLRGDCVRDRLTATQNVSFRYLNLNAVKSAASKSIDPLLKEIVESRPASQVYDGNGGYLESVTDEVYRKAVTQALADAAQYTTSSEFAVTVEYQNGKWLMRTSNELLSALLGGTA